MSSHDEREFAELYRPMSEMELMDIAREYDELMEAAQSALRAEFKTRGLEPPLIDEEEDETPQRQSAKPNLVTVRSYRDLPEALVARSVLEQAGIPCFLRDENTIRLDWGLSNVIGGMRLEVGSADLEEATALISQPMPPSFDVDSGPDFVQPVCPKCGSIDVMADDKDRKIAGWSYLLGLPIPHRRETLEIWKCNICGCKWEDDNLSQ